LDLRRQLGFGFHFCPDRIGPRVWLGLQWQLGLGQRIEGRRDERQLRLGTVVAR
jgi:hypothetical protein